MGLADAASLPAVGVIVWLRHPARERLHRLCVRTNRATRFGDRSQTWAVTKTIKVGSGRPAFELTRDGKFVLVAVRVTTTPSR